MKLFRKIILLALILSVSAIATTPVIHTIDKIITSGGFILNVPTTGASSSTFWRGDGTWATPSGGGGSSGFYGSITYQAGLGCTWAYTSSTYGDPPAATCPTAVVTGSVTAPATQLPQAVVTSIPSATYRVDASIPAYCASGTGGAACRIVDDVGTEIASTGTYGSIVVPFFISGVITYGTSGNHTFKVQCKTALGCSSTVIDNSPTENASMYINIYTL